MASSNLSYRDPAIEAGPTNLRRKQRQIIQTAFPDHLQTALDKLEALDLNTPAELPGFDQDLVYSTSGLLNTEHKQEMWYTFDIRGAPGLARYLYAYALDRQNRHNDTQFKYFTDDQNLRDPVLPFLITSMHPEVVKALICGNMAYRYHNETSFTNTVHRTTTQMTTPGIYFNQLFDCGTDLKANTQQASNTAKRGKGFSYDQWLIIIDGMKLYCDVTNPASTEFAKEVDYTFISHSEVEQIDHDIEPQKRRYFTDRRKKKLEEFLEVVEARILKPGGKLDNVSKAEQANWAVYEIGYSIDTLDRLKDHVGNKSTNWIWGLICAIGKVEFGSQFRPLQGQILYLCHESHRNLGEALCSVLASSYHDEMGCNPKRAGSIGTMPATGERGYRTNIIELLSSTGSRHRGWERGMNHTLQCTANIIRLEQLEKDEPLAQAKARAEAERKALLDRAKLVLRKHKIVQYLTVEHRLLELVRKYAESRVTDTMVLDEPAIQAGQDDGSDDGDEDSGGLLQGDVEEL